LAPPETHLLPIITPLILTRKPQVPPQFAPITPPFYFQLVPLIPIVPKTTTLSTSCTQDLDLVMNNQIIHHHWEQNPLQSLLSMNNPMDAAQLDVVVHMTFYLPFDMIDGQGWLAQDASILSSTR